MNLLCRNSHSQYTTAPAQAHLLQWCQRRTKNAHTKKSISTTLQRIVIVVIVLSLLRSDYATAQQTLTIKGSDTMVILVQRWTEMYPDRTKVRFQVTGGGSGTGISALINGTTDICSSSRPIKHSEVKQLQEKYKYNGMEVRVARDGIAVYINEQNPVGQLTVGQVRRIFTGEVTNWKDFGGKDAKIVLYSRENNSGTYEFFKEHVLNKQDFAPQTQHMVGTGALVNAIAKDPNAIGFGGIAYASGVKAVALAFDEKSQYVLPNETTILQGTYPGSRLLYFYLKERPQGVLKSFIDWVISKDGQKVVSEVGYLPIKKF